MIQPPITIKDKDGTEFIFRTPQSIEAQFVLDSVAEIAASSPYILSTPESFRSRSVESQIKWIEDSEKSDVSIVIGVYDLKGKLVGLCNGRSYADVKRKHRAALGVSIHLDCRGRGLGKTLMKTLIGHMRTFPGIKIIELDVMSSNTPAIKMYENLGFRCAGVFPKAYILTDGQVTDNLTMYMEV